MCDAIVWTGATVILLAILCAITLLRTIQMGEREKHGSKREKALRGEAVVWCAFDRASG